MKLSIHILAAAVAVGFFSACQPSLDERIEARVAELQTMSELGTVEYTVTKVVKASDEKWYAIGDRKILFTTTARLKAGVRLDTFDTHNITVNEHAKSVIVTLPHAELLSLRIDPEDIKLIYQENSGLRSSFSAEERNQLLQQGEAEIRAQAPSLGLLQDAEAGARQFFEALLRQAGFQKVMVRFVDEKKGGGR